MTGMIIVLIFHVVHSLLAELCLIRRRGDLLLFAVVDCISHKNHRSLDDCHGKLLTARGSFWLQIGYWWQKEPLTCSRGVTQRAPERGEDAVLLGTLASPCPLKPCSRCVTSAFRDLTPTERRSRSRSICGRSPSPLPFDVDVWSPVITSRPSEKGNDCFAVRCCSPARLS